MVTLRIPLFPCLVRIYAHQANAARCTRQAIALSFRTIPTESNLP
jgi:hypothetical protein